MIRLENLTKSYGRNVSCVDNVSLEIEDGELMVLVGPSGSGKSTILKMVAGLTAVTEGKIFIDDREVTRLPPQDRDIAMVFQNYALYPNMSVRRNLGFGLRMRKTPRAEIEERVNHVAGLLGLQDLLDRRPAELSGGERQRVAMGRAIVRKPLAFLLDEPLSNLDAKLRVQVRADLIALRDRLRTTTIYVTHDQVEAMTLGHRVAVLRKGIVQQVDTGHGLFARPANRFVASFIGSPSMNFCETRIAEGCVTIGANSIPTRSTQALAAWNGRKVIVGMRPTDLQADEFCTDPGRPRIVVVVKAVEELGSEKMVLTEMASECEAREDSVLTDGARNVSNVSIQARVDARTLVKVGDMLRLALDPDSFYYFDPESEKTIAWPGGE